MKRIVYLFIGLMLIFALLACENKTESQIQTNQENTNEKHILIAYFSMTKNTAVLAEYAADILNADTYEIIPKVPYTEQDIAQIGLKKLVLMFNSGYLY